MKITDDCIDYNTVRLIEDNADPWALSGKSDDMENERLVTLGYIRGVLEMAKCMKEVLKASITPTDKSGGL